MRFVVSNQRSGDVERSVANWCLVNKGMEAL